MRHAKSRSARTVAVIVRANSVVDSNNSALQRNDASEIDGQGVDSLQHIADSELLGCIVTGWVSRDRRPVIGIGSRNSSRKKRHLSDTRPATLWCISRKSLRSIAPIGDPFSLT